MERLRPRKKSQEALSQIKFYFVIIFLYCASLTFAQMPGVRFTEDALDVLAEKSALVVTGTVEGQSFTREPRTESEKPDTELPRPRTEAQSNPPKTEPPKTAANTGIGSDKLSGQIFDNRVLDEQLISELPPPPRITGTLYYLRVTQVLKRSGGSGATKKGMHVAMYVAGPLTTDSDQPCPLTTGESYIFFLVPLDKDATMSLAETGRQEPPFGPAVLGGVGRQWSVMPLRKPYVSRVRSYVWKKRVQFWHWF